MAASYIHGGAWRSPLIDSTSVVPALHYLNPEELDIAGVASINYGLSPYPDHATLPSSPSDPSRNNKHPKHLEDVMAALDWLQSKYAYGSNYVLAGHSCGATLAFQILTRPIGKSTALCKASMAPTLPSAVVGLHGIYDVTQLVKDFEHIPMYRSIVEGAFGKSECGSWKIVSPAGWPYERLWSRGGATVLAHSDEDEMVNWKQTELMVESLSQGGKVKRKDVRLKTTGKHDEIWGQGKELASVLIEALKVTKEILE